MDWKERDCLVRIAFQLSCTCPLSVVAVVVVLLLHEVVYLLLMSEAFSLLLGFGCCTTLSRGSGCDAVWLLCPRRMKTPPIAGEKMIFSVEIMHHSPFQLERGSLRLECYHRFIFFMPEMCSFFEGILGAPLIVVEGLHYLLMKIRGVTRDNHPILRLSLDNLMTMMLRSRYLLQHPHRLPTNNNIFSLSP
jgi:hypothetical protein